MNCLVCGEPAGFSSVKLKNGKLCKKCAAKLPSLMIENTPYFQEYTLRHAMEYIEGTMKKFDATASYGSLHIDSIHGLFAYGENLDSNGKPKTGNNVFSIYDLDEIALFCTNPRSDHGSVFVDVEFRCTIKDPFIAFSKIVKRKVRCDTKRVDSQHVEWEEPKDMVMFRTLFNQMLSGAFEKINAMLCGKTVHELELDHARAVLMVTESYTKEDLKKARRLLMKVYHPDKALEENVTREAQIINSAYNLLNAELEKREQIANGQWH
jgi:hypothetical protein